MGKVLKILLTGGHAHATAYALIKEIKKSYEGASLYWVGPKTLVEGRVVRGVEEEEFVKLGVEVHHVNAGRLQTKFTRFTLNSIIRIPVGFVQSIILIAKIRPNVVVSFGGFVGLPVVFGAWLFGIPVVLHEQTTAAGRGNIYAAKFASKIAISRTESRSYFPAEKTVVTGNPIDDSILNVKRESNQKGTPVIFITGGHTGSAVLNESVGSALPRLLKKYRVIHQTGSVEFDKFKNIKNKLSKKLTENYEIHDSISPRQWPKMLKIADVVVSRAGANSVSQFIALKIPSLLIPIPHTYLNEQVKNAEYAVDFGIAEKLEQSNLTSETLINSIENLYNNRRSIEKIVKNKKSLDLQASRNFAKLIFDEAKN